MFLEATVLFQVFLLAVGSGVAAGLILRTEVPIRWLLCAGMVGVVVEPILHTDFGPRVFHHSLLTSVAAAAFVIIVARAAIAILQTWHHQFRRS
jgi:hypothetical protein